MLLRTCFAASGPSLARSGFGSAVALETAAGRGASRPSLALGTHARRPPREPLPPPLAVKGGASGQPAPTPKPPGREGVPPAAPSGRGGQHTVAAAAVSVAVEVAPAVAARVRAARPRGEDGELGLGGGGGGEMDVALAGSDDELDVGGEGAGQIVPAGVLGAAGLSAVRSSDAAVARSGAQKQHRCLVLDASYRPINTINWFKAVMMDVAGKVDVLDYYDDAYAYSAYRAHSLPAVLRARASVNMHELVGRVALTRRNVLSRDKHACQYCGSRQDLTLDHVVPVCRGGRNSWDNLVACCMHCNQRKGGSLLRDLPGWRLRAAPREPTSKDLGLALGVSQSDLDSPPAKWQPYLEPYRPKKRAGAAAGVAQDADAAAAAGAAAAAPAQDAAPAPPPAPAARSKRARAAR